MSKIYVVTHGTEWKVKCEHCGEEVKKTQREAIILARKHVTDFTKGTVSQILVQGADSKFRTEWTYGVDPYPPKG